MFIKSQGSTIPSEITKNLLLQNKELVEELKWFRNQSSISQNQSISDAFISDNIKNENSFPSKITDSNKLNQRLKELFKDRITCFREAVYLLTGYKVTFSYATVYCRFLN
jgi:hypothetical protein